MRVHKLPGEAVVVIAVFYIHSAVVTHRKTEHSRSWLALQAANKQ